MKYSVVLALFLGQISTIKIENKLASKKDNNDIQLAAHALRDDDRDDDHDDETMMIMMMMTMMMMTMMMMIAQATVMFN